MYTLTLNGYNYFDTNRMEFNVMPKLREIRKKKSYINNKTFFFVCLGLQFPSDQHRFFWNIA